MVRAERPDMTESAATPAERRTLVVRAVMDHRRSPDAPVEFRAVDLDAAIRFDDRRLELTVDAAERDRLDDLLASYPVFKPAQPATRKAPSGTVVVAAVADPKHLADFVDDCFCRVYGAVEDYELAVG